MELKVFRRLKKKHKKNKKIKKNDAVEQFSTADFWGIFLNDAIESVSTDKTTTVKQLLLQYLPVTLRAPVDL